MPSNETFTAVHEWLADHGIDSLELDYSPAKDWIKVALPVQSVEQLLKTKYHEYLHDSGDSLIRATEWSLPQYLHNHIATIQPTSSFLRLQPRGKVRNRPTWNSPVRNHTTHHHHHHLNESVAAVCNTSAVTPLCLRTLYGTVDYTVKAANQNSIALNDFLGEINNRSDIEIYLQMFRPEAVEAAYEFTQISIAGGTLQQTPENITQLDAGTGIEGNLDAETVLGISWPTPLTAYSTGGLNPVFVPDAFTTTDSDEPYLVWLEYILSLPDTSIPKVISTSYGDDEQTIPYSYASHACNMFAQLGARGISVLFASGDEGVGPDGYCYRNDGTNSTSFLPEFPSSCPFVTAVGATTGFDPEGIHNSIAFIYPCTQRTPIFVLLPIADMRPPPVAVYDSAFSPPFTSGAGFSNYFPRPAYQEAAVSAYLSTYIGDTYTGLYNASGRGYPDIAAQGQRFSIVWNGSVSPVDGTSCSTPTAAAVLALVNDALIAAGKSSLGFLNVRNGPLFFFILVL